ncbi:MAG TPA: histidine kinase [Gemmatimonadaceae bacterium]|nr:histidine kinase [Gemmatimonadaceae bacterium]
MTNPGEPNPNRTTADHGASDNPRFVWGAVVAVFTAIFVLRFSTFYLDDITRALPGTWGRRIVEEGTGALGALLLFPVVFLVERRFPVTAGRWRQNWPVHVLTLLVYSVLHTSMMWGGRSVIYALTGGGPYDYGRMSSRYFMEAANDIFAYVGFVGVLTLLRIQKALREREVRVAALARDAAESRLEALSVRLQPHFLFNALNTISAAVYEQPAAADEMIGHLGDLLRHALRTSDQPEIALSDELEVLQSYLAIIGARFGDRLHCDVQADPAARSLAVPAFLLQPLVENAARHGSVVEYPSSIHIRIERAGDELHIAVENEIPWGHAEEFVPGTGLATTRDRLRLLYGDAHSFTARASGNRFEVSIRIPARMAPVAIPMPDPVVHAGADR